MSAESFGARESDKRNKISRRDFLKVSGAGLAGLAVFGTVACGGEDGATGSNTDTITFGTSIPTMASSWVALAVAQDQGYFEQEGIKVDSQFLSTSGDVLKSMAAGRTDIGCPTPEAFLPAIQQGQDLQMVYAWTRSPVAAFAVKPDSDVQQIPDLRGGQIGVQELSAGPKLLADASLTQAGIDPQTEVKYVAVGTGASAYDALRRDRVDALMLYDAQYAIMRNIGAKLQLMRPQGIEDLFATTFVAKRDWVQQNDQELQGFGRAWAKASVWAIANPRAAIRIMWDVYPNSKTNTNEKEEMSADLSIFQGRMKSVTAGDPAESESWGRYPPKAVEHWITFAEQNDLIEPGLQAKDIYTNQYVEAYNNFDSKAVRADAEDAGK